jgi:hypothetical protein
MDCELIGLHDLIYKAIIFDESDKNVDATEQKE